MQIIPELITNADAAIAASGRPHGKIELSFKAPDPEFLSLWQARMRLLRVPALRSWRFEVSCRDDGIGVNASVVDRTGARDELAVDDLELRVYAARSPFSSRARWFM